ncbi:nitronate monooxygenase [Ruegeria sp.]|uniref:nitronate monooxygenase n=1 Tax=Ruegeria sp. TaxID=1879320 RepID=UPI003C7B0052
MIDTRLTRLFGLTCPVVLAPMHGQADGRLAAAVATAGALGIIGAGVCDAEWIDAQFRAAGNEAVGCGFVTWRLAQTPELLCQVLAKRPRAIFLSHGDPRPFADRIADAKIPLICQVQGLQSTARAVEAGASVIVAQGRASAGISGSRSTLTLLPEVADFLHREAHDTLLLAAGGIADSRGLAACIVMGADGVVMGTRLWASREGQGSAQYADAVLQATGDDTEVTKMSGADWSDSVEARALHISSEAIPAGEGIGLIRDMPSVDDILRVITQKASRLMVHAQRKVVP